MRDDERHNPLCKQHKKNRVTVLKLVNDHARAQHVGDGSIVCTQAMLLLELLTLKLDSKLKRDSSGMLRCNRRDADFSYLPKLLSRNFLKLFLQIVFY